MTGNVKIKVCGMRDPDNIRELGNKVSPDYMGLIFFSGSERLVEGPIPETSGMERVGVFVNSTKDHILNKIENYQLDLVQLHGDESIELIKQLYDEDIKVIKVIRVKDSINFAELEPFLPYVHYFLFDAAGKKYGGNGKVFPWQLLENYPFDTPYLIGGGINHQNIDDIIHKDLPKMLGIDLNSGFEISPGIKDIELLVKTLELK